NRGRLKAYRLPTGQYVGNTVTNWLYALHQGQVFGLPYRIFVCTMGLIVAMLSVTGIYLWLKKRRTRRVSRSRSAMCKTESASKQVVVWEAAQSGQRSTAAHGFQEAGQSVREGY
ncbi:MAG: PepSY domain-containing protein, partial [Acidobacteria bacterium]|nr:PepSY domain-containing protein [Acidobacteriota bacterium]